MFEKHKIIIRISFLFLTKFQILHASTFCKINLKNDLHEERSPILVSYNNTDSDPNYIYPTLDDPENILITPGESIAIFCPGKANRKSTEITKPGVLQIYETNLEPSRSIETIKCVKNNKFKVNNLYADENNNNIVNLKNISCEGTSDNAILRKVNEKCGSGKRYEIGYDLGNDDFLKTIDICHDEIEAKTLWAHSVLIPVNKVQYRHKGSGSVSFKAGQLYEGMHMSSKGPYELVHQFQTIMHLVDDDKRAAKFCSNSTKDRKFLAKGHLIARADKFYKSEQDSTYFFANVVPMWQQVNAQPGNWFFVEEYLRRLSSEHNSIIDVWAGGIGDLELKDASSEKEDNDNELGQEKFLKLDDKIPVPRVLFKCAVDRAYNESLCFLVVNNPYLTKTQIENADDEYIVCEKYSPCEKINSEHDNPRLGYFYCCRLADFIEYFENELGLEELEKYKNYKEIPMIVIKKIVKIKLLGKHIKNQSRPRYGITPIRNLSVK